MSVWSDPAIWWLTFGVILVLSEFLLPGLVAVFLGASALCVALAIHLTWIQTTTTAITTWFILSIAFVMTLRQIAARFLPAEAEVVHTDEDLDAIGQVVDVVREVSPDNLEGRIRYLGTHWPARTEGETIPAGAKAKLRYRENIAWVIGPYAETSEEAK